MSRASTAAGRVAHGLRMGSCTPRIQHVLQSSMLPVVSVRQHAVQSCSGTLTQQPLHSTAGETAGLTGCGMLTLRGWSTAVVGRASALCRQSPDAFKTPAEPHWEMTTVSEALECSSVQRVEADQNCRQEEGCHVTSPAAACWPTCSPGNPAVAGLRSALLLVADILP